jgi:hypothetical protein
MTYEMIFKEVSSIIKKFDIEDVNDRVTLQLILEAVSNRQNVVKFITSKVHCSKNTVSLTLKKLFPYKETESILRHILNLDGKAFCPSCENILDISYYYPNSSKYFKHSDYCIECSKQARINTYNKNPQKEICNNDLRKRGLHRPTWQSIEELANFYKGRPTGYHVDHIIPITHPLVCGLHVISNLQYLTKEDNLSKNNTYIIE